MINMSLSLIVIGVVVSWGCVCPVAVVVGSWSIISLFWALPSVMPFHTTSVASNARTVRSFLGPIVERAVILLRPWSWYCWSGYHRFLKFISGPLISGPVVADQC